MIAHTFLAWGQTCPPQVHILTCAEADRYIALQGNASECPDGFASMCTFGLGFTYAVPAVQQAMEGLALGYVGAHQDRVRYMAACLALGRAIEPEADDGGA